jgi:hypothetical protein
MDDRLAKLLLENNLLQRQQSDERRLSLLEKLATDGLSFGATPIPGILPPQNWQKIFIFDHFIGGVGHPLASPTTSIVGNLNWFAVPDAYAIFMGFLGNFIPPHIGIIAIGTIAQNYGIHGWMVLPNGFVYANYFDFTQFVAGTAAPLQAGDGVAFGMVEFAFNTDRTAEGIYFSLLYGEANWQAVTRDASTSTVTDTGVPFVDSKFYLFEIKRPVVDKFEFYINQILVATHTTNITTVGISPSVGISTPTQGSFQMYSDYFSIQYSTIAQIWD